MIISLNNTPRGGGGATPIEDKVGFPPSTNWYISQRSNATAAVESNRMIVSYWSYYVGDTTYCGFSIPIQASSKARTINWQVRVTNYVYIVYWINGLRYDDKGVIPTSSTTTRQYDITLPPNTESFAIGFANSWAGSQNGKFEIISVWES